MDPRTRRRANAKPYLTEQYDYTNIAALHTYLRGRCAQGFRPLLVMEDLRAQDYSRQLTLRFERCQPGAYSVTFAIEGGAELRRAGWTPVFMKEDTLPDGLKVYTAPFYAPLLDDTDRRLRRQALETVVRARREDIRNNWFILAICPAALNVMLGVMMWLDGGFHFGWESLVVGVPLGIVTSHGDWSIAIGALCTDAFIAAMTFLAVPFRRLRTEVQDLGRMLESEEAQ